MRRLLARFKPWAILGTGIALAAAATGIVVARARPFRTRSVHSAPKPPLAHGVVWPGSGTANRATHSRPARIKLNVVVVALLAASTVSMGTVVTLALPSEARPFGSAATPTPAEQPDDRGVGDASRRDSLNFGVLATQAATRQPTPSPIPTPCPTPKPTVTPTPPPLFVWPAEGWISEPMWAEHLRGIDIAIVIGEPVRAVRGGRVSYAGGDPCCSYGYFVILEHDKGWTSLYAHLSAFAVVAGEDVSQGEVIGFSGESGETSGPHLHFELRSDGEAVNPVEHLPRSG